MSDRNHRNNNSDDRHHTRDDNRNNRDEGEPSSDSDKEISVSEVLYSASSYHAMVVPVSMTMILAALAVVFINTEQSLSQGEADMSQYQVWKTNDEQREYQSTGKNLAMSIGNSLVIVSFICAMTFVIVLFYKFRFMKCLIGYMIFSSSALLGLLGGTVFLVAIEKYRIPIDKFTFYFGLYNFAIVGTISIFFQMGIPTQVTQGYLVCTSVIMAWQLAHFDAWTTWSLLVMLALYDLCAVLTPCGPLKALVNLMQQEDAPDMPGLLYEAQLPSGVERQVRTSGNTSQRNNNNTEAPPTSDQNNVIPNSNTLTNTDSATDNDPATPARHRNRRSNEVAAVPPERIVKVPLAIAKVYHLRLIASQPSRNSAISPSSSNSSVSTSPLLEDRVNDDSYYDRQFTAAELCAEVEAVLPSSGGRIESLPSRNRNRYQVYDRHGDLRRTLIVDRQGRVMQEIEDDSDDESDGEYRTSNSIKLGLGDFVFYSVLVSKAAMYSFTTFAACMLVILAGMGATLILLSVYKAALPALPISIFLGVVFYLLTRIVIEPWIQTIFQAPFYV